MEPRFLEQALELAERGRGTTHPNPLVGAVVVSGDEVVGEGWHERKGGPHAEVVALVAQLAAAVVARSPAARRAVVAEVLLDQVSKHVMAALCASVQPQGRAA